MEMPQTILQGQVSQVTFGVSFVVIEGFEARDEETVRWWLRLEKQFYIRPTGDQARTIDVLRREFFGAGFLIECCGVDVASFSVKQNGLLLVFANGALVGMEWTGNEAGCAELTATSDKGMNEPELICMASFPDSLEGADPIVGL